MSLLTLKFKLLHPHAVLPSYAHATDAAFDLHTVDQGVIKKGEKKIFSLGLAAKIPERWFVSIRDRSGLAAKNGIHVLGGVIDSGYRGEWKVILVNLGNTDFIIERGDRIAQGILGPAPQAKIVKVTSLEGSDRGEGGFGSTGK